MTSRSEIFTGGKQWPPEAAVAEVSRMGDDDLAIAAAEASLAGDIFSEQYSHNQEVVSGVLRRMMDGSHKADVDEELPLRFINVVARSDAAAIEVAKRVLTNFGYIITSPAEPQTGENNGK